jgi:hypothetical protein
VKAFSAMEMRFCIHSVLRRGQRSAPGQSKPVAEKAAASIGCAGRPVQNDFKSYTQGCMAVNENDVREGAENAQQSSTLNCFRRTSGIDVDSIPPGHA